MKYKAFSNKLHEYTSWTGETKAVPQLFMSLRYKGTSLKKAREAILPIDEGCSGEIHAGIKIIESLKRTGA